MSIQRNIRRRIARGNFALDVHEAAGALPNTDHLSLALAGNTHSSLRRFAAKEAHRRAKAYEARTGIAVLVTKSKIHELALKLVRDMAAKVEAARQERAGETGE